MVTLPGQLDLFEEDEKRKRLLEEIAELDAEIDRKDDQGVDTFELRQELSRLLTLTR